MTSQDSWASPSNSARNSNGPHASDSNGGVASSQAMLAANRLSVRRSTSASNLGPVPFDSNAASGDECAPHHVVYVYSIT